MTEAIKSIDFFGISQEWKEPNLRFKTEPVRVWLDFDAPSSWMSLGGGVQLAAEVGHCGQIKMLGPTITLTICAPLHPDASNEGEKFFNRLPNFFPDLSGKNWGQRERFGVASRAYKVDSAIAYQSTGMPAFAWNGLEILEVDIFAHIKNNPGSEFTAKTWFLVYDKRDDACWRSAISQIGIPGRSFSLGGYRGFKFD